MNRPLLGSSSPVRLPTGRLSARTPNSAGFSVHGALTATSRLCGARAARLNWPGPAAFLKSATMHSQTRCCVRGTARLSLSFTPAMNRYGNLETLKHSTVLAVAALEIVGTRNAETVERGRLLDTKIQTSCSMEGITNAGG